jgi:hypothetical protein
MRATLNMKMRSTVLFVASAALLACVGRSETAASDATHQVTTAPNQPPVLPGTPAERPPPGLDAWSDLVEATGKGEGAAYLKAIAQQATSLDNLSDEALRERLLAQVEPLAEDDRWWRFVHTIMPTECVRTLDWKQVSDMKTRLGTLIDLNLDSLETALRPGSPRQVRQSAVIMGERELPVIRELRKAYVNKVLAVVFQTLPMKENSSLQEIRSLLRTP